MVALPNFCELPILYANYMDRLNELGMSLQSLEFYMKPDVKQYCQNLTKIYLDKLRHTGYPRIQDCWIPGI